MFFNNMKAFEMIELYQREQGFVYDLVIRFRSDIVSANPMPIVPDIVAGMLYIPENFDYNITGRGAINDQIAYGDVAAMKVYSSVYSCMGNYLKEGVPFHPETLLYHHLKVNGLSDKIYRFPFRYSLNSNRKR